MVPRKTKRQLVNSESHMRSVEVGVSARNRKNQLFAC